MKRIHPHLQKAFAMCAAGVLFVAAGILAIDAYEMERTGRCAECVVLHKIAGWDR